MIYERVSVDKDNKIFIPLNVEGGNTVKSSRFWTSNKSCIVIIEAFLLLLLFIGSADWKSITKIIVFLLYLIISSFVVRFFIFEEIYYKKSLINRKKNKQVSSAKNWGILYTNELENGSSMGFVNGAIGVFLRLDRGSIVGQDPDYEERCKEIYSNFLRDCSKMGYYIKLCNTMELASKDPRLVSLNDNIKDEPNPKLRDLLQLDVNYMRNLADYSYYDTETVLLYTFNPLKLNDIVQDALELSNQLLQGAYMSRYVLNEAEAIDLHSELNNIGYFDIISAKNEMFESNKKTKREFYIYSFKLKNGNEYVITPEQRRKLAYIYNRYIHDKGAPLDIIGELSDVTANEEYTNAKMNTETIKKDFDRTTVNLDEKDKDNMLRGRDIEQEPETQINQPSKIQQQPSKEIVNDIDGDIILDL